jgi:hypothetical protein
MEKRGTLGLLKLRGSAALTAVSTFLGTVMKFVAIIDGKKKGADRITSFIYPDDGPVPPIVNPEDPQKAKDGGPPAPDSKPDKNTPQKLKVTWVINRLIEEPKR